MRLTSIRRCCRRLCRQIAALPQLPRAELWLATTLESGYSGAHATHEEAHYAGMEDRVELIFGQSDVRSLSSWAQDDSKPMNNGNTPTLLLPRHYLEAQAIDSKDPESNRELAYREAVRILQHQRGVRVINSVLSFDGGDIVVGRNHIFVGSAIVTVNCRELWASREDILDALGAEFGAPVVQVGTPLKNDWRHIPLDYHVDFTMAVASPSSSPSGKDIVFLGDHDLAIDVLRNTDTDSDIIGDALITRRTTRSLQLDLLESELRLLGYETRRVPSIYGGVTQRDGKEFDIPHFNYMNVIFSGSTVLAPHHGIPALDEAAHAVYRDAGLSVVPMASARELRSGNGGPRCASCTFR